MLADKFQLHTQLKADTIRVSSLTLSELLLVNDSRYLWCILVPRLTNLRDFDDVPAEHKMTLHDEIDRVSIVVRELAGAYKINVAALGNMVEQLHVHVIARKRDDAAWPGPVWGVGTAEPYSRERVDVLIADLRIRLSDTAS